MANFSVSNGKVLTPTGSVFAGRGVAVTDFSMTTWVTNSAAAPLTTLFPDINFIRLAVESGYNTPSYYQSFINTVTALGIVVCIENHMTSTGSTGGGGTGVTFTGSLLTTESNWYAALATTFINNPYVWFGTNNEPAYSPSLAALSTWQQATYNAIRNTGNTNIIEIEQPGGGNPGTMGASNGLTASVYNAMTNIVFGPHFYAWVIGGQTGSVSQAAFLANINSTISTIQTITSQNGLVPVGCFEFGPSTDGSNLDVSGQADVLAVMQSVDQGGLFGYLAWRIDNIPVDNLTDASGNLTSPFGTAVAADILNNAVTTPTPTPTTTPNQVTITGSLSNTTEELLTWTGDSNATDYIITVTELTGNNSGPLQFTGITLSPTSVVTNAASGTVVGTLAAQTNTGVQATNITYSITVNDGSNFKISGNNLLTNATNISVGTHTITVNASSADVTSGQTAFNVSINVTAVTTPTPPTPTPTTGTRVTAPLTGSVTTGTWNLGLTTANIATAPFNGALGMQYSVLLPAQYNTNLIYPILVVAHPDFDGMNGSSYKTASSFVTGTAYVSGSQSIDSLFNNVAFRTAYPCIIIAPQCWQPGSDTIDNFGGYGDNRPNGAGNEQGVNTILASAIAGNISGVAASSIDVSRFYGVGYSLGAIGVLSWLVDNNQFTGLSNLKLWTAGIGMSDQLVSNNQSNASLFANMTNVPYMAISTSSDNDPTSWDEPMWTAITGNSNYPSSNNYTQTGMSGIRAGSSQFYYINDGGGDPTDPFMIMNANGGTGTAMYNWLFSQTGSGAITPTPTPGTPSPTPTGGTANGTILTTTSGGSITDANGNVFTLTSGGVATENGTAMAGGSGTSEIEWANTVVYFQDAASGSWYTWTGSTFVSSSAPPTITGPTPTPPTPTPPTPTPTGATLWYQNPGVDGGFWKQPFQTTAQWITSGPLITALRNGSNGSPTGHVHLPGDYSVPWYIGKATDPLCTVTDGNKSIQVRIPAGSIVEGPTSQYDQSIGGADSTQPYLVWSISGATINTGSVQNGCTITGTYGFQIDDGSGNIMCDAVTGQPGTNNSIGGIQDFELTNANASPSYVIPHMLAYALDPNSQASSAGPIWPLKVIDNSYTNGGPIAQGYTIGIPSTTARPTGQTRGFYLLFDNLQQFGWFYYNVASNGCLSTVCYPVQSANNALANDVANSISAVMAYVCILNNQSGPSSLKGFATGGTNVYAAPPLLDLSATNGVPGSLAGTYPANY